MRDIVLDYLNTNKVTGFKVTEMLPFNSSGQPLYQNNFKSIYVDQPQTVQEPLIDVLNGHGIVNETTTITVYVVTDAKQIPANYDTLVSTIKNARLDTGISGVTQRATSVSTEYSADALVTQFNINFRKLIVNT
jgi:hypothetical protein